MDVSAAPPSGGGTGPRRPHTPGTLIAALWVPFATVAGVVTSWQVQRIDGDWVDRQQAACRRLAFPTAEHVAAWAGPALGVSAVVVCVLLARWLRRRRGVRLAGTGPGLVAYLGAWPAVLTIPLELFLLYATYSPVGSGPVLGDCG
ncbi:MULTISPECIES: hypothetical protein [Streptomyces]|uniref:hypothetical protein n=1 Tax=Streptomyces TaxID=1883 RepID=UPI00163BA91D|nr:MULTISPECIES: hypothetical protein [Streptomyces]MBC2877582.1 hypothetical protein [Streptomyces sp. TYQ1024]UBI36179.1 hypothetical protein K7I03_06715 [Streptomyces mobaraensis]UKW28773.1 hypothetical protein MCU78_06700 [Streptomyces sp. TYQ1024]